MNRISSGDKLSYISASWVTSMVKDPVHDCLWLSSNDGLVQFWPQSGAVQVHRPQASLYKAAVMAPIFNHLMMDNDGLLWCGSWGLGLVRFNTYTKQFSQYTWSPEIKGTQNICSGIFPGDSNQLWVTSADEGLMLFNKKTGAFRKVRTPGKPNEIISAKQCYQSNATTLWVADQTKLYRYDLDTNRFNWYPLIADKGFNGKGLLNFIQTGNRLFTGTFYNGGPGMYDKTGNRFSPLALPSANRLTSLQRLTQNQPG